MLRRRLDEGDEKRIDEGDGMRLVWAMDWMLIGGIEGGDVGEGLDS